MARIGLRHLSVVVTLSLLLGASSALAAKAPAAAAAPLPGALKDFKSPLSEARTNELAKGEKPKKLPKFKAGATAEQRQKAIRGIDRTMVRIKRAKKAKPSAEVLDGIRVWEAMTPAQKTEMLQSSDQVLAMWPAAVAATAAAVVAAVEIAEFAYDVYKDQRDQAAKENKAEGGDDDEGGKDGGDPGEDTGAISAALSY